MAEAKQDNVKETSGGKQPGFCSATCVDRKSLLEEIKKPEIKTSDVFYTCNLPKRFEHPHWFNGYGCQLSKQHPFYRTSASEYGWYPPDPRDTGLTPSVEVSVFKRQDVKDRRVPEPHFIANSGRRACGYPDGIYSVPSVFFPAPQTFTNRLAAAGMYRNYSLNTGMDPAGYS